MCKCKTIAIIVSIIYSYVCDNNFTLTATLLYRRISVRIKLALKLLWTQKVTSEGDGVQGHKTETSDRYL